MYVNHADMYTILKSAIRTAESSREQLLRTFRRIGYARSVEWGRKFSHRKSKTGIVRKDCRAIDSPEQGGKVFDKKQAPCFLSFQEKYILLLNLSSLPVHLRRGPRLLLKYPEEILRILIPGTSGNRTDILIRPGQKLLRLLNPDIIQVIHKFLPRLLLKKLAQITSVQVEQGGYEFLRQILLIILGQISADLVDRVMVEVDTVSSYHVRDIEKEL